MERLLNKPHVNEVILREQSLSLNCCKPLEILEYIERGFRAFHTGNIGTQCQTAAKLPSVKLSE